MPGDNIIFGHLVKWCVPFFSAAAHTVILRLGGLDSYRGSGGTLLSGIFNTPPSLFPAPGAMKGKRTFGFFLFTFPFLLRQIWWEAEPFVVSVCNICQFVDRGGNICQKFFQWFSISSNSWINCVAWQSTILTLIVFPSGSHHARSL